MTERHMKTLFVLPGARLGEIERLQAVLGPDFHVVQMGHALVGRRDLKAAIIAPMPALYAASPLHRDMLAGYIDDILLRLDGAPLIRL